MTYYHLAIDQEVNSYEEAYGYEPCWFASREEAQQAADAYNSQPFPAFDADGNEYDARANGTAPIYSVQEYEEGGIGPYYGWESVAAGQLRSVAEGKPIGCR